MDRIYKPKVTTKEVAEAIEVLKQLERRIDHNTEIIVNRNG
jgi:hypothetical protein